MSTPHKETILAKFAEKNAPGVLSDAWLEALHTAGQTTPTKLLAWPTFLVNAEVPQLEAEISYPDDYYHP